MPDRIRPEEGGRCSRFVLRRLVQLVPVLVGLSLLLFVWVRALPGGPGAGTAGGEGHARGARRGSTRRTASTNRCFVQYVTYVTALLHGDFGTSIQTGQPVTESFLERFPATIELACAALLLAVVVGVPLGYLAARHQGRAAGHASSCRGPCSAS